MEKYQVIVVLAVILIVSLFFEVQPLVEAKHYYPRPWGPYIIFNSPENNTYLTRGAGSTVTLDISVGTITGAQAPGETYVLTYSLDGQPYQSLPTVYEGIFGGDQTSMAHSVNTGRTSLPYLAEGNHTITAHCILLVDNSDFTEDLTTFFVIDNTAPQILIQSLNNKTYDTTNLPLNFTVNEPFYNPSYSLDGSQSVEIEGNTTLTGLTSGSHSVIIYAVDRAGNIGKSEAVYFAVSVPVLSFFSYSLVILPVGVVVILCLGLLVYFKRYKGKGVSE